MFAVANIIVYFSEFDVICRSLASYVGTELQRNELLRLRGSAHKSVTKRHHSVNWNLRNYMTTTPLWEP